LKPTSYGKDLDESIHSYDELTSLYLRNLLNDYTKLIDNISIDHKPLVHHLYQRYELENIKVVLRTICYERSKKEASKLLFPLLKYQTVSIDRLLEAKDLFDFINRLKATWYFDPLDNSAYRFEKEGETFPLEIALDLRYYAGLWEIVSSLKRKDKKNARSLIGIQLDALNILWIIRFKESYHFSPEEILNYSLTYGSYISQKKRKKLAYSIDQKDIISNLDNTPYKGILNDIDDPEITYAVLLQYIFYQAKKNWIANPFQIGIILDYLFFKEIEVRNLITITEAKKIGLPTEKINRYLVESF
jgi:V/A-type H+-transporting ATPase subunit C